MLLMKENNSSTQQLQAARVTVQLKETSIKLNCLTTFSQHLVYIYSIQLRNDAICSYRKVTNIQIGLLYIALHAVKLGARAI